MPYTGDHILLTVQGDGYQQTETWQFGVRCSSMTPITDATLQQLADDMIVPTQTFWESGVMLFSNKLRLVSIKAAHIRAEGTYPPDSQPGIAMYPSAVTGSTATSTVPQATVAVTLLTDLPRGRASRGRFYLPVQSHVIDVDGRLTAQKCDEMEVHIGGWLTAIKATAAVENVLVMSKLGAGTSGIVEAYGVGRVVDTMRSRRRSLLEARTPSVLP